MPALITLSHGSRHPGAAAGIERLTQATGLRPARAAHLEFNEPDLTTAALELAQLGETEAVVVPLLFTQGYHQRVDVPRALADGIAIRLYSEQDFESRPEFTDPEILRTNLASVILQMVSLKLGDIEQFPFIQPPEHKAIRDGLTLLHELGALHDKQDKPSLTTIGRDLARIPLDPRMARMLIEANTNGCLDDVMVIVAAMTIQDVRERPLDFQAQADQAHARFKDKTSDFLSMLVAGLLDVIP